jgi:hypothetical protein
MGSVLVMTDVTPLARFKDICIDANDTRLMGGFWAATLGLRVAPAEEATGGGVKLVGDAPEQTVWINRVSEPRTVKQRVHLDVHAATDVLPGTTPISAPGEFPWRVLADPEGGELCTFVRAEVPTYRLHELVVDSADPEAACAWWADVLAARRSGRPEKGWYWLEEVPGLPFGGIDFVPVPEPKTVKNRIHWDVSVADVTAIEALVERGAGVLRRPDEEIEWTVMADPEGNEFCVFVA